MNLAEGELPVRMVGEGEDDDRTLLRSASELLESINISLKFWFIIRRYVTRTFKELYAAN